MSNIDKAFVKTTIKSPRLKKILLHLKTNIDRINKLGGNERKGE